MFSLAGAATPIAVVVLLALVFPAVLLVLTLAMERVDAPLRRAAVGEQVAAFLEADRPEDVEAFVRERLGRSLNRYWRDESRVTRSQLRSLARHS